MNQEQELLVRSNVYRFLSTAFSFPDETTWERLQDDAGDDVLHALEDVGADLEATLKRIREAGRQSLAAEHVATFGLTSGGGLPPYEGPYGATNLFQEADCMADVAGFYRAFGLGSADDCRERSDHITVELEFMHFLVLKQAYAQEQGWADKGQVCVNAQKLFLKDHLGRWAPFYLRKLADLTTGKLFESVAGAAAAWVAAECRRLGVALDSGELRIASFESSTSGANFSCEMDLCHSESDGFQMAGARGTTCEEANQCVALRKNILH